MELRTDLLLLREVAGGLEGCLDGRQVGGVEDAESTDAAGLGQQATRDDAADLPRINGVSVFVCYALRA